MPDCLCRLGHGVSGGEEGAGERELIHSGLDDVIGSNCFLLCMSMPANAFVRLPDAGRIVVILRRMRPSPLSIKLSRFAYKLHDGHGNRTADGPALVPCLRERIT